MSLTRTDATVNWGVVYPLLTTFGHFFSSSGSVCVTRANEPPVPCGARILF